MIDVSSAGLSRSQNASRKGGISATLGPMLPRIHGVDSAPRTKRGRERDKRLQEGFGPLFCSPSSAKE